MHDTLGALKFHKRSLNPKSGVQYLHRSTTSPGEPRGVKPQKPSEPREGWGGLMHPPQSPLLLEGEQILDAQGPVVRIPALGVWLRRCLSAKVYTAQRGGRLSLHN